MLVAAQRVASWRRWLFEVPIGLGSLTGARWGICVCSPLHIHVAHRALHLDSPSITQSKEARKLVTKKSVNSCSIGENRKPKSTVLLGDACSCRLTLLVPL